MMSNSTHLMSKPTRLMSHSMHLVSNSAHLVSNSTHLMSNSNHLMCTVDFTVFTEIILEKFVNIFGLFRIGLVVRTIFVVDG